MLSVEQIEEWLGQEVIDVEGERLGKLDEVYYATSSGEARFVVVKSGLLSRHSSLAPLAGASVGRDYLKLAYSAEQIGRVGSEIEAGHTLDGEAARRLGAAYEVDVPSEDLESATSINQRRGAAAEADERAEALDQKARNQAREAEEARSAAHEASEQATRKTEQAQSARAEAEQARAEVQRDTPP